MNLFLLLLGRLVPLYIIIVLGYFAGKKLYAQKESIAPILIYILAPVVVFDGVVRTPISLNSLSLPIFFFLACCGICAIFYVIASFRWKDANRNILAFTAGTGNTGYFGIPVSLAIFGDTYLGLTVLSLLGFIIYENSVGFFVTARGHYTIRESLVKVLTLPTLYAFILAVIMQRMHVPLGEIYQTTALQFRGAYSILGMMMIGLGIASMQKLRFDWLFISMAFFAKFIVWPALVIAVITVDRATFGWFTLESQRIMILMAIVPMAANTIVFATQLRAEPEKASIAVLISTVIALFLIPIVATAFLV